MEYYHSRFLELSAPEVKALLAGYYLFDTDTEMLCQLFDLTANNLRKIVEGEVDLFDDILEEFYEEMAEQFQVKEDN
ncbi:hypothetical protein SRABI96_02455 [Peribacillus sp. Bi96]|uniref:hypothetical protein n=1 Tax=Peribacillus sp. Bi96 TaxID=2884273 RepID=UPI001D247C46|nr:hypothetical protein [Peribacillus sp. Bi96]CAH0222824.1 hypothetical protein SRABI96_02455 [Peribacillus sp. Bi96]